MTVYLLHKENECPYLIHKRSGYETWNDCDITGTRCLREIGQKCSFWDEIKTEDEDKED